jgi:hypothetical protein
LTSRLFRNATCYLADHAYATHTGNAMSNVKL